MRLNTIMGGVLCGLALAGCDEAPPPEPKEVVRPVRVATLEDAASFSNRYFVGSARAAREATLAFRVSGTVASLDVAVGDEVERDAVVATLDPAPFQAEVDRLTADLESAVATYENSRLQTERQRTLFEKGHVAEASLDRFIAGETSSAAQIKSIQGSLDRATLDLSYTSLRAPFDGRVVATYVEEFEEVQAQYRVLRILDSEAIEMVVDIPERLIGFTPYVEDIAVTFDAIGDVALPATVVEIGSEASSTTRTYPVTLRMEQPEGVAVLPGMTGRTQGRIPPDAAPNLGLLAPPSAVFTPEGAASPHVWVLDVDGGTVSAREVEIGVPQSGGLPVKGVEAGETIVTAGVHSLREGQRVKPMPEDER